MRKYLGFAGVVLILILCFCGFAGSENTSKITDDPNAEILLFASAGGEELLVYADGRATHIYRTDGAETEAPYAGQFADLNGNTLTVFAETDNFTAVRKFDAETLAELDALTLPVTGGIRFAVSDGREFYLVTYDAPRELKIFAADGSLKNTLDLGEEIFGLQAADDAVYILLNDRAARVEDGSCSPAFSYANYARPYVLLGRDLYVNVLGEVRDFSGALWADACVTTQAVLENDRLYWISDSAEVSSVSRSGQVKRCTLSGEVSALTGRMAVVRKGGALYFEKLGDFVTDEPTATPTPAPRDPSEEPKTENVWISGEYLFAEPGVTAAKLRAYYAKNEIEVYTAAGAAASGRVKTGMTASIDGTIYTIIVCGDINGSGTVNTADLSLLQQALTGEASLSETEKRAADLNENGDADVTDLILLSNKMRKD